MTQDDPPQEKNIHPEVLLQRLFQDPGKWQIRREAFDRVASCPTFGKKVYDVLQRCRCDPEPWAIFRNLLCMQHHAAV